MMDDRHRVAIGDLPSMDDPLSAFATDPATATAAFCDCGWFADLDVPLTDYVSAPRSLQRSVFGEAFAKHRKQGW